MSVDNKLYGELKSITSEEWIKICDYDDIKESLDECNQQIQETAPKVQTSNNGHEGSSGEEEASKEEETVKGNGHKSVEDLEETVPQDEQQYVINTGNNPSPAEQDQEGFKSEIAKQLFDVPRKKILQRTELPRRMILPMSMQKTAIYLATQRYTKDCETGPEHWMYEYGYLMLSAGRKVRMEGMAAFQPVAEGGSSENINF
jgi:hypothetical protein